MTSMISSVDGARDYYADPVAVDPPPPEYTDQQVAADASALWDATEGGLSGWGTDEDAIWNVLNGKSPEDLAKLSQAFKDNYGRDLMQVLEGELSGGDLDRARALMQGSGNRAEADAVVIQDEIDDTFVDEQHVLNVIESRHGPERDQIALEYAARNGGPTDLQGAKEFLLERLEQNGLEGDEVTRARALLLPEGGDVAAGQARADAAKAKVAVDGMGTDEQTLKDLFAGKTGAEITAIETAYEDAYGHSLRDRLNDELSGSDREQIFHLLDPVDTTDPAAQGQWAATQDAMRLHEAIDGAGTDEQALRDVLNGKTPEQLQAISAAYREQYGVDLREELQGDLGGDDADEIMHLLNAPAADDASSAEWQTEQDAIRLHAAVDGAGTDEATIREILGGRSKTQIDAIAQAYQEKYGEDLRSRLSDELDGREKLELLDQLFDRGAIDFQSDPRGAIEEQIRRGRELQAFEG
ncbi:MAG: annexin, partial [Steroidobacter sp.]